MAWKLETFYDAYFYVRDSCLQSLQIIITYFMNQEGSFIVVAVITYVCSCLQLII